MLVYIGSSSELVYACMLFIFTIGMRSVHDSVTIVLHCQLHSDICGLIGGVALIFLQFLQV